MELSKRKTEHAIKLIKDTFQQLLASSLYLHRVTAPLFVQADSGINDTLNGEKPVSFYVPALDCNCEIVQSLAKWKRMKLAEIHEKPGYGIYTDMNAIRPNEDLDELHSLYVDQWDWEKVISKNEYNESYLWETVQTIYTALKNTEYVLCEKYELKPFLPKYISILTSQELANMYPDLTPKMREFEICKRDKAVFITGIGGKNHDGLRAPDYDNWDLNGDILIWSPVLNMPIEISSMGIRVNSESLNKQLEYSEHQDWKKYEYHQKVLNNELPLTIGGGIGQSRLCMLLLQKKHIGEVQVSVWPDMEKETNKNIL